MASTDMVRILVSDHLDAHIGDIDPTQVAELTDVAQVNGEHALTIVTTQELEKTNRLLVRDARGHWHEYVVLGIASEREDDGALWHEYYCVWSMQYDLSATFIDDMYGCGVVPGHASVPQTARRGLECALEGTSRWAIGSITVTTMAAASFYRRSGWEGLQTVVEKWGGELHATISVDSSGIVSRAVDLLEHEGRSPAVRRFDYGFDVTGIKRTVSDDIWPCRIVPLGASQETEEGGYTRRPSIESVNGGVMWLQDDDAVPLTRVPDGDGGWEYPTLIVKNDTYEEPADLKAWALEHITEYTRPIVSYEASVAQFARAGMDAHGVGLGDEVVVVDRTFGDDGLRLEARVLKIKQSLLDAAQTELTIGNLAPSLAGEFASVEKQVTDLAQTVENGSAYSSSTAWVQNLLARLNADINATGGFTYITEGQGIRTYDVAVTNPLVGAEAHAVVEVKGGTIRIANTKDAQGQWEWKTVFTSGYVNAEVIRAIGQLAASHVEVDANGVHVYDPDGTEVALFAATPRIGEASGYNVTIEPSSIDFNKGASKVYGITAYSETVDGEYTTVTTNRGTLEYGTDGGSFVEGEEAHFFEKDGSSESWDSKLTLKALDNHRPDGESEAPWHDPLIELRVNRSTSSGGSSVTSYATIMSETWVVWDLQNTAQGHIDRRNYIIDSHDAAIALRHPVGTYTGTSSTATASAAGWQLTYFNSVVAEVGSPRVHDYHFTNGVLTATRDCVLEISGVMNWTDAIAGNRGFGVFSGTAVGSGTEASTFQNFPSGVSNRKSVVFPPKLFTLSAGDSLTFGRYQQANAIYQNGTNFSWLTVKVVG